MMAFDFWLGHGSETVCSTVEDDETEAIEMVNF